MGFLPTPNTIQVRHHARITRFEPNPLAARRSVYGHHNLAYTWVSPKQARAKAPRGGEIDIELPAELDAKLKIRCRAQELRGLSRWNFRDHTSNPPPTRQHEYEVSFSRLDGNRDKRQYTANCTKVYPAAEAPDTKAPRASDELRRAYLRRHWRLIKRIIIDDLS